MIYSSTGSSGNSIDVDYTGVEDPCWCQHCPQLDGIESEGFPIRFAVRSLGWVQMSDEDLTPERSSKAVNRCIVGLSVGKNDINDVVGRWGDVRMFKKLSDFERLLIYGKLCIDGCIFSTSTW